MAIFFDPTKMLKKVAPKSKIKRMVSDRMSLRRTVLANIGTDEIPIDNGSLTKVVRNTISAYKQRIAKAIVENQFERSAGTEEKDAILADPKQLIQRVQNEIIYQTHQRIQDRYAGQKARWLPSDAEEPRPEHQAHYGKIYVIGEGIDGVEPGDEWGCKCGVEILTDETKLDIS